MTRLLNTPLRVAAVLAAGALALTACSGDDGDSAKPSGSASASASATEETPTLPSTGWARADRDKIADGGKISLAVDTLPANWQLNNVDAGTVDDQNNVYFYLPEFVQIKEDGSWEADPNYATSVALKSEDPQVAEIKINPKATWSDGTPITVDDVKANWNALNGKNKDFAPISTNVWEDVASVEAGTDERDVLITFAKKNADWASVLGNVYPAWAVDTPDHFNKAWAKGPFAKDGKTFVSAGPFIVKSIDANGQVLTYEKNPKWWGEPAKLDTVVLKAVSRDGQPQAFANSELDAINLYGNADALKTVQGRSDAEVERSLGTTFRHVTLNGQSDAFSKVEARKAFAMALDRKTLGQAILSGVGSPVVQLDSLIYLPGQNGYQDNASEFYKNDPAAAKQILDDAGIATPIAVRFVIPSDNTNSANIATLVQAETKAAGFDVKIDTVPSADFFTKYINTDDRNFDATYFAWQGTPFPVSSTKSIYYPADSGQNYPGITDDTLGADWDAANAELDPAARITKANAIDKKIVGLFGTLPLFPEPYAWGVKKGLVNYGPVQFESVHWENVGYLS